ncbi:MAG: hypothetical protein ACOYXT_20680 [Bacteroidota bacterium]
MKRLFITGFVCALTTAMCAGQHTSGTLVASHTAIDRMSIVKTSIDIPSWHEKSFWSLYDKYSTRMGEVSMQTYRSLDDLARTDANASDVIAFENARKLIDYRYAEISVLKQYFNEIGQNFNGVIALQFLQTETLMDMMECSGIYEATSWKKFRFHPNFSTDEQFKDAKHNMITRAVMFPEQHAEAFWRVYARYEEECDALLGEKYDMIALYAGDAHNFTPAVSKQLGHNLLEVMGRELKLKDKYFTEMKNVLGSSVAARFLAWEDYYSLVSKMYAWADAP